ncbi:hypothetical protein [Curtobacterium sp. MCBD17_040]|uniref:hypothetical protein n=1 Tax=Curtobacterium sp. MCBD17_040 TaxID=2175674 RepID=UPI000DA81C08|nr:hypothetical protein [Curtobacterium sp. MCBD17_040]WIB65712.1 hypothetical protein DEI94_16455 [Curtobacterium sp. MCBD17_040]
MSRRTVPIVLTVVAVLVAAVIACTFMLVINPRKADQAALTHAQSKLSAALRKNTAAHNRFTAATKRSATLEHAMAPLPSTNKALFPANVLTTFSNDLKALDEGASLTEPNAATDLPTGKESFRDATLAVTRVTAGVTHNTSLTDTSTGTVQSVYDEVAADLRSAARVAGSQSASVLTSNQGASNTLQTSFAQASDIDTTGSASHIAASLAEYASVGQELISDNAAHPVKPVTASPKPSPKPSPTPSPAPSPSASPSKAPQTPKRTPEPTAPTTVNHTPHVIAQGQYSPTCTAGTQLFTQSTSAGNSITVSETSPYTYTTFSTTTGWGVKVLACTPAAS